MPEKDSINCEVISLEGEWTIERAAELRQLLADRFSLLARLGPAPGEVTVDLAGLSGIDACGCQLLLVFLEELRRRGIAAGTSAGSDEVREKIDLLGFRRLFAAHPLPTQGDEEGKEFA